MLDDINIAADLVSAFNATLVDPRKYSRMDDFRPQGPRALRHKQKFTRKKADQAPSTPSRLREDYRLENPVPRDATTDPLFAQSTPKTPVMRGAIHTGSRSSVNSDASHNSGMSGGHSHTPTDTPDIGKARRRGTTNSRTSIATSSSSKYNPVPHETVSRNSPTLQPDHDSLPRTHRSSTVTSATSSIISNEHGGVKLRPEDIQDVIELRRAGSHRRAPEQIPRRSSGASRNPATDAPIRPERRGSGDGRSSQRTDTSISEVSAIAPEEPRRTAVSRIFGYKQRSKGKPSGDDEDKEPGKREMIKQV